MKKIRFTARPGAPFPKEKAEEVGQELERIKDQNAGQLRPDDVVSSAKDKKHPLHPYFDWKDGSAAEKWRKHQARLLINHVQITYEINEIEEVRPAFISIRHVEDPESRPAYIDMLTVSKEEDFRKQALQDAMGQLRHWREKYKWLSELGTLIHRIDEELNKFA